MLTYQQTLHLPLAKLTASMSVRWVGKESARLHFKLAAMMMSVCPRYRRCLSSVLCSLEDDTKQCVCYATV